MIKSCPITKCSGIPFKYRRSWVPTRDSSSRRSISFNKNNTNRSLFTSNTLPVIYKSRYYSIYNKANFFQFVHKCTDEFFKLFPGGKFNVNIARAEDLIKEKFIRPLIKSQLPDFLSFYSCRRFNKTIPLSISNYAITTANGLGFSFLIIFIALTTTTISWWNSEAHFKFE